MKKHLVSIFTLLFILPTLSSARAEMSTISGKVLDENNNPLIGAAVMITGTTTGASTNLDGVFSINVDTDNISDDAKLEVSYVGYKDKIVSIGNEIEITLQPDAEIETVVVTAPKVQQCEPKQNEKEVVKDIDTQTCYVIECASERYKLVGTKQAYRNNKLIAFNKSSEVCEGVQCEEIIVGTHCEDQVGQKCTANDPNYKAAEYKWENNQLICEIKKCNDGYIPNDDGSACIVSEGPCSTEQLAKIEHATAGELKDAICYATECEGGYEPSNGKCVAISGNCNPMPENAVSAHREWDATINAEVCIIDSCKDGYSVSNDKKSCISPTLSKEDSEAKIAELQENANAMKEREQSTANKLLGAASIGAMGIGGMQVASALAEQKADNAAEQDMSAYIATFKCDYGQGMNIQGGESNITLPGANVLLPIYNEYTTLAADLKTRKEALGMTPGIESEVILDAATSGLYDNAATGITDGAFTSLSRALMDENSADAAEWAEQREDTSSQLRTGAIVAGAGALVGIVGNILINEVGDKTKESSAEIIAKYDAKRQSIRQELQNTEQASKQEVTANPPTAEENKDPTEQEAQKTGITNVVESVVSSLSGDENNNNTNDNSIVSDIANMVTSQNKDTKQSPDPIVTIYNESMFDSGKTEIKSPTTQLDKVIDTLKSKIGEETVFEMVLVAHTDKDKIIQTSDLCTKYNICDNEALSTARANAVKEYIRDKWTDMPSTAKITTLPVGDTCAKGTTSQEKALDRRVDFYVFFAGEDINTINTCQTNTK